MATNYARLKATLTAAGYTCSPGDRFFASDMANYVAYVKSYQFLPGNSYCSLADGLYGLEFNGQLPDSMAAEITKGIQVSNVSLWSTGMAPGTTNLYIGTNNPASHFQVSNGEKIQLGISLRYDENGFVESPISPGVYEMPSTLNGKKWAFAFSANCADGDTFDDYTITLDASLDSTGAPTPVLTYTLDGTDWTSSDGDITDSEGVVGTVTQNIEQYALFQDLLLPDFMKTERVPYGTYTITMNAIKTSNGEVTTVVAKAIVSDEPDNL